MRSVCTTAALFPFQWAGLIQQILFLSLFYHVEVANPSLQRTCTTISEFLRCHMAVKSKSSVSQHRQCLSREVHFQQQQKHQHGLGCIIRCVSGILARAELCQGCVWKHECILPLFTQADSHGSFDRSETSELLCSWAVAWLLFVGAVP